MKTLLLKIALLSFFSLHLISNACINEFGTRLNGELTEQSGASYIPYPAHDLSNKTVIQERLNKNDSLYKATGNLEYYNNYGVQLIYLGEFERAKNVFIDIEKKNPGLYQTATNLGTIYEVLGKNDSALIWIKKGVKRNPESHNGSEWIHVKILEAKLKKQDNWKYLNTHSLLNLDFGNTEIPSYKGKRKLRELADQISAQLSERISFIPPKDPIIAQLLFDLGNAVAIIEEVESALEIYAMAQKYGYDSKVLQERKKHFTELSKKATFANETVPPKFHDSFLINLVPYAIYALIFLILGIIPYWLYKRRKSPNN